MTFMAVKQFKGYLGAGIKNKVLLTFGWLGGGRARTVVWATDRRLCSFTCWAMIGP